MSTKPLDPSKLDAYFAQRTPEMDIEYYNDAFKNAVEVYRLPLNVVDDLNLLRQQDGFNYREFTDYLQRYSAATQNYFKKTIEYINSGFVRTITSKVGDIKTALISDEQFKIIHSKLKTNYEETLRQIIPSGSKVESILQELQAIGLSRDLIINLLFVFYVNNANLGTQVDNSSSLPLMDAQIQNQMAEFFAENSIAHRTTLQELKDKLAVDFTK